MNNKSMPCELSYYGLYLLSFLKENHPYKAQDSIFIETRSALAADTFEKARLEGRTVVAAQELAMSILTEGVLFSPYNTIIEILWNEFGDEVPQEHAPQLALELLPTLTGTISKYSITDDFSCSPEYGLFYNELVGSISLYLADHGI